MKLKVESGADVVAALMEARLDRTGSVEEESVTVCWI
jgi:hypothetical protein